MGVKENWYKANHAPEVQLDDFFGKHNMTKNIENSEKTNNNTTTNIMSFMGLSIALGLVMGVLSVSAIIVSNIL